MSENDRDVLALLDRAAAHTPPLHLDRHDVVTRGEQLVRRRRASGAGMAVGGLALAGAVWLGSGLGEGGIRESHETSPAGRTWEVAEPSPFEIHDGLDMVGNAQPLTLSRGPRGSTVTFAVDGVKETVTGRTLGEDVEVYVGDRSTLVVWEAGARAEVWPEPLGARGSREVTVAGERLVLLVTDAEGYEPEDVLFFDEDSVRTATGSAVQMAELTHDRVTVTAFDIPGLDASGYLHGERLTAVDTMAADSVDLPWWRGGGSDYTSVARLPREAVFAREVLRDESRVVRASESQVTTLVGDLSMVLFVSDWAAGGPEAQGLLYTVEWSTDGETWHPQPPDLSRTSDARPDATVRPGGEVTLLDDTYRVAVDSHGWPQLLEGDGSVFLTVSDADGPPASGGGGVVMWREHWWPWSDRNEVHFAVDGQPVLDPAVEGQDAVTITGPAGDVGLVAVPAGS